MNAEVRTYHNGSGSSFALDGIWRVLCWFLYALAFEMRLWVFFPSQQQNTRLTNCVSFEPRVRCSVSVCVCIYVWPFVSITITCSSHTCPLNRPLSCRNRRRRQRRMKKRFINFPDYKRTLDMRQADWPPRARARHTSVRVSSWFMYVFSLAETWSTEEDV